MNIGQAGAASGLPPKTIRYYEEIGLVVPARAENGYRSYDDREIHNLRFIHRARELGFSIDECRQLLALYDDPSRSSADVKAMALAKIREVDRRIVNLKEMRETLAHLASNCHGDSRPECPILRELSGREGGQ